MFKPGRGRLPDMKKEGDLSFKASPEGVKE
jgi:hypothetical protein